MQRLRLALLHAQPWPVPPQDPLSQAVDEIIDGRSDPGGVDYVGRQLIHHAWCEAVDESDSASIDDAERGELIRLAHRLLDDIEARHGLLGSSCPPWRRTASLQTAFQGPDMLLKGRSFVRAGNIHFSLGDADRMALRRCMAGPFSTMVFGPVFESGRWDLLPGVIHQCVGQKRALVKACG